MSANAVGWDSLERIDFPEAGRRPVSRKEETKQVDVSCKLENLLSVGTWPLSPPSMQKGVRGGDADAEGSIQFVDWSHITC
jgi:hypothetical protein